jgi:deazaflavin-dependent oxidoreductase (nitroreductase family)
MRRVNRAVTNPVVSIFAGLLPPLAIVHHSGRTSGRAYRTPVVAFPTAKGFVTPLPYGIDTDWCRNVLDAGRCALESRGRRVDIRNPHVADADEALPLLPALLRPALRAANLPGYLLLERKAPARRRRS